MDFSAVWRAHQILVKIGNTYGSWSLPVGLSHRTRESVRVAELFQSQLLEFSQSTQIVACLDCNSPRLMKEIEHRVHEISAGTIPLEGLAVAARAVQQNAVNDVPVRRVRIRFPEIFFGVSPSMSPCRELMSKLSILCEDDNASSAPVSRATLLTELPKLRAVLARGWKEVHSSADSIIQLLNPPALAALDRILQLAGQPNSAQFVTAAGEVADLLTDAATAWTSFSEAFARVLVPDPKSLAPLRELRDRFAHYLKHRDSLLERIEHARRQMHGPILDASQVRSSTSMWVAVVGSRCGDGARRFWSNEKVMEFVSRSGFQ